MRRFPEPIITLANALTNLPGVGPKTALRYVYALLGLSSEERAYLARAITNVGDRIQLCRRCFTHTERPECDVCTDASRETTALCVVAGSRDISALEATGKFRGRYHVLGGLLNPVEGIRAEHLRVQELVDRLLKDAVISEIILALPPDIPGEMTMHHLSNVLKPLGRRVTRLARGLPMGADLEYADEVTLSDAITGRRET